MQKDGMDIQSHTMNNRHLNHLSANALNFEIGGSKQCLANHGYHATTFAYPYNEGSNNATVVNVVAKYYSIKTSLKKGSNITYIKKSQKMGVMVYPYLKYS
jgi:hypothetical protein